jgi:hypothetical protein
MLVVVDKPPLQRKRQHACDEATAFNQLQKLARGHRQKLAAIGQSIILAEQAFKPHGKDESDTDSSSDKAS